MTSGKLHKKPDDLARERLTKRTRRTLILSGARIGKLSDSEKKTPSQKRSENGKAKELKRSGVKNIAGVEDIPDDCFDCPEKANRCGKMLEMCGKRHLVLRCKKCGIRVRARIDAVRVWTLCPICRG